MYLCVKIKRMARKIRAEQEGDPSVTQKAREKRKWQIAFRRYVLDRNPSVYYAPYFGLDIQMIRNWFELQFEKGVSWENFGTLWQFEHIVPVAYFNFEYDLDLQLCWNFTNIRVESIQESDPRSVRSDLLLAKSYFETLYHSTQFDICRLMLDKIRIIESECHLQAAAQQEFIRSNTGYLKSIESFSSYEYELLNSGRPLEEVLQEIAIVRRFK